MGGLVVTWENNYQERTKTDDANALKDLKRRVVSSNRCLSAWQTFHIYYPQYLTCPRKMDWIIIIILQIQAARLRDVALLNILNGSTFSKIRSL